jgi:hypothetical protein
MELVAVVAKCAAVASSDEKFDVDFPVTSFVFKVGNLCCTIIDNANALVGINSNKDAFRIISSVGILH